MKWRATLAAVLLAGVVPPASDAAEAACRPAARGADCFIESGEARLHVVAWGGKGPPLILLAGLNNTARIFDDLAPRLASDRTVYALTRRGFGRSQARVERYDNEALVADIVAAMDALGVRSADIVGHSIAGGEMTALAASHPERVRRLVYLDAAYDRRAIGGFAAGDPAEPRGPPLSATTGPAAYVRWRSETLGFSSRAVAADIAEAFAMRGGRFAMKTPVDVVRAVSAGDRAASPDYSRVQAPALALYAPKTRPEGVPPDAAIERRAASVSYSIAHARPWMLAEKARFDREIRCGLSAEIPGAAHYFFLERPRETATVIADFLNAPLPCSAGSVVAPLTRSAH